LSDEELSSEELSENPFWPLKIGGQEVWAFEVTQIMQLKSN
jgi:hypothetical protein